MDGQTDDGKVIPKCHLCLQQVTQKKIRTDGQTDRQTNEWTDGRTVRLYYAQNLKIWRHKKINFERTDKNMDEQTNGRTDGPILLCPKFCSGA